MLGSLQFVLGSLQFVLGSLQFVLVTLQFVLVTPICAGDVSIVKTEYNIWNQLHVHGPIDTTNRNADVISRRSLFPSKACDLTLAGKGL